MNTSPFCAMGGRPFVYLFLPLQGDLNEYNQCQTQLQELYVIGIPGQSSEFTAYRILYHLYLQATCSAGSKGLLKILQEISSDTRDAAVQHALRVRQAVSLSDYHLYFSLYESVPNMGGHIMHKLLPTVRLAALRRIIKA